MHTPPFGVPLLHPTEDHTESDAGLTIAVVAELVKAQKLRLDVLRAPEWSREWHKQRRPPERRNLS